MGRGTKRVGGKKGDLRREKRGEGDPYREKRRWITTLEMRRGAKGDLNYCKKGRREKGHEGGS